MPGTAAMNCMNDLVISVACRLATAAARLEDHRRRGGGGGGGGGGAAAAAAAGHTTTAPVLSEEAGAASSLQPSALISAICVVFPGQLGTQGTAEASRGSNGQQQQRDLVLQPRRMKVLLTSIGLIEPSTTNAVCLAAVLGYLAAEVLELAGNAARDNKKSRVTPRYVCLAIRNDEELNTMLGTSIILSGGVVPNIEHVMLPNRGESGGEGRTSNGAEPPASVGMYRQSPLVETVLSTPALYMIAARAGCFRPTDDALDKVRSLMVPVLTKLAAAAEQAALGGGSTVVSSLHVLAAADSLTGQHGMFLGSGNMRALFDPSFQSKEGNDVADFAGDGATDATDGGGLM